MGSELERGVAVDADESEDESVVDSDEEDSDDEEGSDEGDEEEEGLSWEELEEEAKRCATMLSCKVLYTLLTGVLWVGQAPTSTVCKPPVGYAGEDKGKHYEEDSDEEDGKRRKGGGGGPRKRPRH